MLNLHRFASDW